MVGCRMNLTCFFLLLTLLCNSSHAFTSSHGLPVCKSFSIVVSKSPRKPQFFLLICTGIQLFSVTGFGSLMLRIKFILYFCLLFVFIACMVHIVYERDQTVVSWLIVDKLLQEMKLSQNVGCSKLCCFIFLL